MNNDLHRISDYVSRLVFRERLLLLARVALQLGLLAGVVTVFSSVAPGLGLSRPSAVALLVLLLGVGIWAVGLLPMLLRWGPAGDPLRQARRVEALVPGLRGRLVTTVQRLGGGSAQESSALVGLAASRALTEVNQLPNSRVHSAVPLLPMGAANAMVGGVALLALLVSPLGPSGLIAWWLGELDGVSLLEEPLPTSSPQAAKVGDILIRYQFPAYTGLEPLEVPNSTGDVQGPPGTRVSVALKSQRAVTSGALLAYDQPAREVELGESGRTIRGSFDIGTEEGTWRLRTVAAGVSGESRPFQITPQPDLPPEVNVDADPRLEVAVGQRFSIPWIASDDYGVSRVSVSIDGKPSGRPIFESSERRPSAEGELVVSPRELGLFEGAKVRLSIVALDNDTVSGQKQGRSREIDLVVLGDSGLDESLERRLAEMKSVMLTVLADFLEEDWPAGETSGDIARWGEGVSERFEAFDELATAYSREWTVNPLEAEAIYLVQTHANTLIRYTQVAFTPGSTERPSEAAWLEVSELRTDCIVALEDSILNLDKAQENLAMRQVRDAIERLERQGQRLAELMAQEEPDVLAMFAELEELERRLKGLDEQLSKLDQDALVEMLNQRSEGMQSLSEQIREALSKGNIEEAEELMKRLQSEIERLSQHLQDQADRRQGQADESMQNAESLLEELAAIEKDQTELQKKTAAIRDKEDAESAKKADELWKQLDAEIDALLSEGRTYREGLESAQRAFYEQERTSQAIEDGVRLQESVVARDLRGSQREAVDARRSWQRVEATFKRERNLRRSVAGPGEADLRGINRRLDSIERLLSKLDQLDDNSNPETRRQARRLEQEQQALKERMEEAGKKAEALSQEFPVRPDGLEEGIADATQQAGNAAGELGEGKPMPAEGAQGVASQRLKDAQEALEQAMQQAQQQQQMGEASGESQSGKGGQGEEPGDERRGGDNGDGRLEQSRFELATPDDEHSPEEYRRALLEGMEGDVPEEYRALKKRYYEELVRQ